MINESTVPAPDWLQEGLDEANTRDGIARLSGKKQGGPRSSGGRSSRTRGGVRSSAPKGQR